MRSTLCHVTWRDRFLGQKIAKISKMGQNRIENSRKQSRDICSQKVFVLSYNLIPLSPMPVHARSRDRLLKMTSRPMSK